MKLFLKSFFVVFVLSAFVNAEAEVRKERQAERVNPRFWAAVGSVVAGAVGVS
jgi:hypothetical protein